MGTRHLKSKTEYGSRELPPINQRSQVYGNKTSKVKDWSPGPEKLAHWPNTRLILSKTGEHVEPGHANKNQLTGDVQFCPTDRICLRDSLGWKHMEKDFRGLQLTHPTPH